MGAPAKDNGIRIALLRAAVPRCAAVGLLALAMVCAGVRGQDLEPSDRIALPLAADGLNRLRTADRFAEDAQWSAALPVYQQILDARPERLVSTEGVYRPVSAVVERRLASLPERPLAAYRLLYDPPARTMLTEALDQADTQKLLETTRRFLYTSHGPAAASAAASALMDRGRFASALQILYRTDAVRLSREMADCIALKSLLCLAHLGRRGEAQALVEDLADNGRTVLRCGDWELNPEDIVASAFTGPAAVLDGGSSHITTAGDRLRERPLRISAGGVDAPRPSWPGHPSLHPTASDDLLLVSRSGVLTAVDTRTAETRWIAGADSTAHRLMARSWPGWWDSSDDLALFLPIDDLDEWRAFGNHGMAGLTLADGRLFALGFSASAQKLPHPMWEATPDRLLLTNELRCVDAETGALRWIAGGDARSGDRALSESWFLTPPAVAGDCAYGLTLRYGILEAVCLELDSGELLWRTEIGAVDSRQQVQRYLMEFILFDANRPIVSDGLAIFPTGQGLVVACEAVDGRICWATPYTRSVAWVNQRSQRLNIPASSWVPTAPVVVDGTLVFAPADAKTLMALRVADGRSVWTKAFDNGDALLGATGGRLYVQADGLHCLDSRGELIWSAKPSAVVTGLGFLAGNRLALPTAEGLYVHDATSGKSLRRLPLPFGVPCRGNAFLTPAAAGIVDTEGLTLWTLGAAGAPLLRPREGTAEDLLSRVRQGSPDTFDAYLAICRERGLEPMPASSGTASLWTELAEAVRTECAMSPTAASAWEDQAQRTLARAVLDGDEDLLTELARWTPMADARRGALSALVDTLRRRGRDDLARRAAVRLPDPENSERSPTGVRRSTGIGRLGGVAWERPGRLIPPATAEDVLENAAILIADQGIEKVNILTGDAVWTSPVPAEAQADTATARAGPGVPCFWKAGGILGVAFRRAVYGLDTTGNVLWSQQFDTAVSRLKVNAPAPRTDVIQRAWRGLSFPEGTNPLRRLPLDGFSVGRAAVCRQVANAEMCTLDAATGDIIMREDGAEGYRLSGKICAVQDGTVWVFERKKEACLLQAYGALNARPIARWDFAPAVTALSIDLLRDGRMLLCHRDGVLVLDTDRMRIVSSWKVPEGIERLLYADPELVVVRTGRRDALLLDTRSGRQIAAVRPAEGAEPVWCGRAGRLVYLLEADEAGAYAPYGPALFASGSNFTMRAVSHPQGDTVARVSVWEGDNALAGPPVAWNGAWVISVSTREGVRLVALGMEALERGQELQFNTDPPAMPAPLLPAGDVLLAGIGEKVVGIAP